MSTATYTDPNFTSQGGTEYKTNIDGAFSVLKRTGAGFAAHEQATPDMTVRVDAGAIHSGVTLTEVAAQSTAAITAPSTNPRNDIVYVDATIGTVGVATGTEAATPSDPAIPSSKIPVCRVELQTSTTSITNSILTDIRPAFWVPPIVGKTRGDKLFLKMNF